MEWRKIHFWVRTTKSFCTKGGIQGKYRSIFKDETLIEEKSILT
jgi:hypothetical protein